MMTWAEFVSNMLEASTKVEKAAVFNLSGQPLVASEDLQVTAADGRAILQCLHDPARSLTNITLDETAFRCFQGNNSALVGMATSRKGRLLVARLTEEALVIVMGDGEGHGSFLFELQKNLVERTRRQMAPQRQASAGGTGEARARPQQQQQQQQQPMSLPQEQLITPPPSSPVGQEQVLVQLHD